MRVINLLEWLLESVCHYLISNILRNFSLRNILSLTHLIASPVTPVNIVLDFSNTQLGPVSDDVFAVPSVCKKTLHSTETMKKRDSLAYNVSFESLVKSLSF